MFDSAVGILAPSIEDADGVVTCDELPTVVDDRTQLSQLLQNLIGNAVKYHGQAPPLVHVSAENSGSQWTISVRDNGIGLAVCRRIVHRHGGKIWLEPQPGKRFLLYGAKKERGRNMSDELAGSRPAEILLDLNMPVMDGREVLAELVKDDNLSHLQVVVLTTSSDEKDVLNMYKL